MGSHINAAFSAKVKTVFAISRRQSLVQKYEPAFLLLTFRGRLRWLQKEKSVRLLETNMVTSGSKKKQKTRWRWPKSKLEASKRQSRNQWVASRKQCPLFIQSIWSNPTLKFVQFSCVLCYDQMTYQSYSNSNVNTESHGILTRRLYFICHRKTIVF